MSVERITLHGGIKNGEILAIPGGGHDDLAIDLKVKDPRTKALGMRQGHYTRVHKIDGRSTSDFEWVGYSTPFVPLEQTSSETSG